MTDVVARDLEQRVRALVRDVPDYPKPGIMFKDITPLLGNPATFRAACDAMAASFQQDRVTHVAAIESRGFLFGSPIALSLGAAWCRSGSAGSCLTTPSSRNTSSNTARMPWKCTWTRCHRVHACWWWMTFWRPAELQPQPAA